MSTEAVSFAITDLLYIDLRPGRAVKIGNAPK